MCIYEDFIGFNIYIRIIAERDKFSTIVVVVLNMRQG